MRPIILALIGLLCLPVAAHSASSKGADSGTLVASFASVGDEGLAAGAITVVLHIERLDGPSPGKRLQLFGHPGGFDRTTVRGREPSHIYHGVVKTFRLPSGRYRVSQIETLEVSSGPTYRATLKLPHDVDIPFEVQPGHTSYLARFLALPGPLGSLRGAPWGVVPHNHQIVVRDFKIEDLGIARASRSLPPDADSGQAGAQ